MQVRGYLLSLRQFQRSGGEFDNSILLKPMHNVMAPMLLVRNFGPIGPVSRR